MSVLRKLHPHGGRIAGKLPGESLVRERRNDTRPVPCDDDGTTLPGSSLMEGWLRDETGSRYAVKGEIDASEHPPEARVPR